MRYCPVDGQEFDNSETHCRRHNRLLIDQPPPANHRTEADDMGRQGVTMPFMLSRIAGGNLRTAEDDARGRRYPALSSIAKYHEILAELVLFFGVVLAAFVGYAAFCYLLAGFGDDARLFGTVLCILLILAGTWRSYISLKAVAETIRLLIDIEVNTFKAANPASARTQPEMRQEHDRNQANHDTPVPAANSSAQIAVEDDTAFDAALEESPSTPLTCANCGRTLPEDQSWCPQCSPPEDAEPNA